MDKINYVSAEGLVKLKEELHMLKTVRRREVASRIEVAKALGDLSENAEYHEAKDEMALLEGRIMEIQEMLKNIQVIEEETGTMGVVRVGSGVKVFVNNKERQFTIVGSSEADPLTGKISNESPIGSALLGTKAGDTVTVTSPAGKTEYRVLEVS